ncbi:hypothetical protein HDE76_000741 [Rhodanobacter sp. ANJX3]|nr:hypothetical protein [Rhodanobacter sp. ANJX3]
MKNRTHYPTPLIALMVALALGGFAVSITQSRAVAAAFVLLYVAVFAGWLVMTLRNRS